MHDKKGFFLTISRRKLTRRKRLKRSLVDPDRFDAFKKFYCFCHRALTCRTNFTTISCFIARKCHEALKWTRYGTTLAHTKLQCFLIKKAIPSLFFVFSYRHYNFNTISLCKMSIEYTVLGFEPMTRNH